MTSSNKTSTDTTTSSSKSSGGGYYTNDFKSSKTGSNSDKSSTKTVSFIFQKNEFCLSILILNMIKFESKLQFIFTQMF